MFASFEIELLGGSKSESSKLCITRLQDRTMSCIMSLVIIVVKHHRRGTAVTLVNRKSCKILS